MNVFSLHHSDRKNMVILAFICLNYGFLQIIMGVLFADILRGCMGYPGVRSPLSGRLCGRVFRGAGLFKAVFMRYLTRRPVFRLKCRGAGTGHSTIMSEFSSNPSTPG